MHLSAIARMPTSLAARCALVVLVAASFLASAPALAQDSASEVALARAQFNEGVAASREGRWDEALAAFARSHELSPRGVTLFNLAGAQAQVGRLVQASESYQRFIASADARDQGRYGPQARQALASLEARIAHVRVSIEGLTASDVVTLDGGTLGRATLGLEMPIDPGAHVVEVTRDGAIAARGELTLAEAERAALALDARPRVVVATPVEAAAAADQDAGETMPVVTAGSDDTGLVVGLVVSGVAFVTIAVVLGVVLGTSSGSAEPFQGTLMPGAIVLP